MPEIRALLPIAEGVEEMEAVVTADVLRRAGVKVDIKGLSPEKIVKASRGVLLAHEGELVGNEDADLIVIPGGSEGARRLAADSRVLSLLRRFEKQGKWIGAICAGPTVLVAAGVGRGKTLTSHPSVKATVAPLGRYLEQGVVCDPKLVTGRGPGVALEFALELVVRLCGEPKAAEVRGPMVA